METVGLDFLKQVVDEVTFPKLIDAIRQGEEWSKGEMAEKLGVIPSYYSDFLNCRQLIN